MLGARAAFACYEAACRMLGERMKEEAADEVRERPSVTLAITPYFGGLRPAGAKAHFSFDPHAVLAPSPSSSDHTGGQDMGGHRARWAARGLRRAVPGSGGQPGRPRAGAAGPPRGGHPGEGGQSLPGPRGRGLGLLSPLACAAQRMPDWARRWSRPWQEESKGTFLLRPLAHLCRCLEDERACLVLETSGQRLCLLLDKSGKSLSRLVTLFDPSRR
jgi:hypothetical protein